MSKKDATAASATIGDPRWQRVLARDASADGEFFYSVSTSGVYCRPSCASRPAKPAHVAFHSTTVEAERAGFRACRRCKPDRLAGHGSDGETIRYTIASSSLGPVLVAAGARGVCAILLGDDASALRRELRERFPTAAVREDADDLSVAASQVVALIESPATADFDLPLDARGTPFQRRVCAILFGDDASALRRELRERFPTAAMREDADDLSTAASQVVALIESPATADFDLPLDARGTPFQRRVWQALRGIRAGSAASYAQIAERIGAPGSARAVAQACAANPVAVAIPCHRVVRSDGALSGYRWGVQRKRVLLQREGYAG